MMAVGKITLMEYFTLLQVGYDHL
uniref:Uncharacterized protein n=1 Tax=Rhizophora mucronata TaxID=61149 RepID=A0A2P2ILY8_RHIMU